MENPKSEFTGRNAFITGGGTGIGRASAIALATRGCSVTIAGRTESTLRKTVADIQAMSGNARYVECDVCNEDSVRAAVTSAAGESGRLDFAVNSAGISGGDDLKATADYSTDFFDEVIGIDLRGTFLSLKYELQLMKPHAFGSIVNIGSAASLVGAPGFAGYVAAKHGQIGLTKTAPSTMVLSASA